MEKSIKAFMVTISIIGIIVVTSLMIVLWHVIYVDGMAF